MARTSKASKATKKTAAAKKQARSKTQKAKAATKKSSATSSAAKRSSKSSTGTSTSKSPAKTTSAGRRKKTTTKKSEGESSKSTNSAAAKKATKTTTPRAKKNRSPFDSRFLEKMRKSLNSERDVYERQAKQLKAEADSLVADLDPGDVQFDEESGEGDTIAVERGRDLALAAKALEMIDEIDHALSKFDLGTYGICEVSQEPIPKERLESIPWAREKVEYKVGGFGRR